MTVDLDHLPDLIAPVHPGLFEGRRDQDVIRITLVDQQSFEGSYMPMAGMHFLVVRVNAMSSMTEGPFNPKEVVALTVLKTRDEIMDERLERKRGDLVSGSWARTRDGYEGRLDRIATLIARTEDRKRKRQLRFQFDDVADEIELAQAKRAWVIAEAHHRIESNRPMLKREMGTGDLYSMAKILRPRPQDFDPDPKVRRARVPQPDHIRNDPFSAPNMMKALKVAGFNARVSISGEILEDVADLFVEFPGGKQNGRFALTGERNAAGAMVWNYKWHGNYTAADMRRYRRCMYSKAYRTFCQIVATGLVQ